MDVQVNQSGNNNSSGAIYHFIALTRLNVGGYTLYVRAFDGYIQTSRRAASDHRSAFEYQSFTRHISTQKRRLK
jgi:hypothetical protein